MSSHPTHTHASSLRLYLHCGHLNMKENPSPPSPESALAFSSAHLCWSLRGCCTTFTLLPPLHLHIPLACFTKVKKKEDRPRSTHTVLHWDCISSLLLRKIIHGRQGCANYSKVVRPIRYIDSALGTGWGRSSPPSPTYQDEEKPTSFLEKPGSLLPPSVTATPQK